MLDLNFKSEKISENVTRIFAFSSELMYLVEGNKYAALIDTGSGIGSLKNFVKTLTNKPIIVLLTHGHVDHAMGASEFDKENVFINQEDAYIYEKHCTYEFRKDGLFLMCNGGKNIDESDFTPIVPIEQYNDLKEGMKFDLGDMSIEIYACAGHTKGSLVMLIPEEKMLVLGDSCNEFTFLFEDYSTSIFEYRQSLCKLQKTLSGKYERVLTSHGSGDAVVNIINENIEICNDIIDGKAEKIPMNFRGNNGFIAKKDVLPMHGNIVYNEQKIMM